MANNQKVTLETEFKHHYTVEADGRILYDCPMEIKSQADLDAYGIQWSDCRTLNFNGSEKITVFFMQVESRELAEYQWRYLDAQHSRGFAESRCWIPGRRKAWIRCPDTVSCARCPHKDSRKPPTVSWDGLIESGFEPTESAAPDEAVLAKLEYQAIRALMDAEDVRIARAFELRELMGYDVKEIADELGVSSARIYQLIARAKAIGQSYRANNR